jgi:hypothetical protein
MVHNLIAQVQQVEVAKLANQIAIITAPIMEVRLIGVNTKATAV